MSSSAENHHAANRDLAAELRKQQDAEARRQIEEGLREINEKESYPCLPRTESRM